MVVIVLKGFGGGGGGGWVVMVGWCWMEGRIYVLVVVLLQVL